MQDSHAIGALEPPLIEQTIDENFRAAVRRWPDREALVVRHQQVRLTYAQLDEAVDEVARALIAMGIDTGDRVGVWAPNRLEWLLVQYATARVGAILVCINPAYRTNELKYTLTQSGVRLLFAARRFKTSDYERMFAECAGACPSVEQAVFFDTDTWTSFQALATEVGADRVSERSRSLRNTDPINIQYTSGTTGLPKGATLTHRNILNNGFFTGEGCGYTHEDRVCVPVPFYHCFGMVMGNLGATSHGACIVIPAESFEPGAVLRTVAEERCTSLYGVPTMFIAELGDDLFETCDLSSLRTGIMAGSPCPEKVMRQVIERMHMRDVTICYGMTETSPVSTQTGRDDDIEKRVGTVGRVHPHVEIRIANIATNETVPPGTPGEFQTRGYSVMAGYWNEPHKTAEVIDADGWMHTGDLAVMDGDGYVTITGRIKDLIIRGGENVSPREIEEFLYTHPDVLDVQVVGIPDEKYGEEICAFVQVRQDAHLDIEVIREFCQDRIAHFKVPRYVLTTAEFPMTVTGKIQKYKLRELAVARLSLTVAAARPPRHPAHIEP